MEKLLSKAITLADYVRDNHHFLYEEAYPGARPLSSTRCIKCGYTMSLHKPQKY